METDNPEPNGLGTLDSVEDGKPDSSYNISFNDIDHAIYSATSNVEFPKDRNMIKKAESYRNLGNESFKRGFIESAIEYYTKAIKTYPKNHEFYTNRALCYKKKQKWEQVEADVRQALNLDENSVKAHYYLGQALLNLGDPVEGMKKLRKAKCLSEHYKIPYSHKIDNEILRAKKDIYNNEEKEFNNSLKSFSTYIMELLNKEKSQGSINDNEYNQRIEQLNMVQKFIESKQERIIPTHLCCKISMCLMRDPVITPSGLTYERELIEKHLSCNGRYDPVTKETCNPSDLLSNYHLKDGVEYFIEKNPWAYDEYFTP